MPSSMSSLFLLAAIVSLVPGCNVDTTTGGADTGAGVDEMDIGEPLEDTGGGADAGLADSGSGTTDSGGDFDGSSDGGTGDDAGFQKCTVFTDCQGVPPLKCMGAHWECTDHVCTGVCGQATCPVEKGACADGTFPGPGGVCLKTCDVNAPDCPADTHCDYFHRSPGCPELCMPLCHPLDGCDLNCPYGHAFGADGCIVCECGGSSVCPPACDIACEYGHRFGGDGCPLCECNDPPACPPLACMIDCVDGYQVDPRGCDICACVYQRPTCGGFAGKQCPKWFLCVSRETGVPDAMGDCFVACDDPNVTCARETACKPIDAGAGSPKACLPDCAPPDCSLLCAWGYQKDDLGCEVCRCAQRPGCPDNDCDIFCPWGFAADVNGCQVCACAVKPGCNTLEVCSASCDNGFKVGGDGCPTCACNDHKCGEPCNMDCICSQDRFGCELTECESWSFCGGFGGQQCQPGEVCVQARVPDGNGRCVEGCDLKTDPCREGVCVPSAFNEFDVQMGCAPQCGTGGCAVFCPGGYEKAYDRCDRCMCHVCPQPKCLPGCEFGRKADRFGCLGCECLDGPVSCRKDFPRCATGTLCDPDTSRCFVECGGKAGTLCPAQRDMCKPIDPNVVDGPGVCIPLE